ncbi:uncharacterized protein ACA1_113550 [Acanthamoeba castellanii str. Neff]|uniref:Uncharacterized protein n=1 Tax=Acanthamoeba castellanii (strain ATCC 30010 / Neff) TaxID=1257118 RepID=L8H4A2_ACACF|nr:uncharacterized protein ACA1_113550 [Acanthamoeba castellanii str. Neff]ELR20010.1 hypothetical protein ACA1_113550 [Acanthamoeba castellanii str. Neff]
MDIQQQQQQQEGQHDDVVGFFEVFKMGHLSHAEVAALSTEELRSRYSLLVPVSDRTQLQQAQPGGCQLAALPKPGHIVVDKTHFQDMMAREARRDEPVFRAHDVFARDRQMIAALLRDKIGGQREQLRALVAGHTQRGKEKHELLSALKDFVDEDQKLWEGILAHPFFHGPQHDDADAAAAAAAAEPQHHAADANTGHQ